MSRAIFIRLVAEYTAARRGDLRDDGRTNAPILIRDPDDGIYKRSLATATTSNDLRVDWLFSCQPELDMAQVHKEIAEQKADTPNS